LPIIDNMIASQIFDWALNIGSFILVLGFAIVIHEYGHFIVARLSGIRVEKFSVGFGKALFSFRRGDTEYIIAPIPLGGYVKMAGENPAEVTGEKDEFYSLSPMARIPTVLAGPAFNILGAFLIFFGLVFLLGEEYQESVVGEVIPRTVADQAGIQRNDVILSVNGNGVNSWDDFLEQIYTAEDQEKKTAQLDIKRGGENLQVDLPVGEKVRGESLILTTIDPAGPAFALGVEIGDKVVSVDHYKPTGWKDMSKKITGLWDATPDGPVGRTVSWCWETGAGEIRCASLTLAVIKNMTGNREARVGIGGMSFGLTERIYPRVERTVRGYPAREAGIRAGAEIVALNGEPIDDGKIITRAIEFSRKKIDHEKGTEGFADPISLTWKNKGAGELITKEITPHVDFVPYPLSDISIEKGIEIAYAQLGITWESPRRSLGIVGSLRHAGSQTVRWSVETWVIVKGLITGRINRKNVGGPVAIAQISARYGREGLEKLLWLCAVLQVNLAFLNLLPIPILDGGHIVVALAEAISRRTFTLRTREVLQYIGLVILLPLFAFVFINDFDRIGLFDWIQQSFTTLKEMFT